MNGSELYGAVSCSIARSAHEAAIEIPQDVRMALDEAVALERKALENGDPMASQAGLGVLESILENISLAESTRIPMCQDTGMFLVFCDIGTDSGIAPHEIQEAINDGLKQAVEEVPYRRSVVLDPLFERTNSGNNLPALYHFSFHDGRDVRISVLLKGFGSENCSGVRMLRPTDGPQEVIAAVTEIMRQAGGKPCPPVFLGIGLGGTMDIAARLSKEALLRDYGSSHPDSRYAALEHDILESVRHLGIGPGGLGGVVTALSAALEVAPTHIAGLPLAVSVNCWADRKFFLTIQKTAPSVWHLEENNHD